jgi:hypothetical protein
MERGDHTTRVQIERAVPDSTSRPAEEFGLADGDWPGAVTDNRPRFYAAGELRAHVGEIPKLMVDPSGEASGTRRSKELEGALRAGRCLRGGRGLLRRERVPVGSEWAEDLAERNII